MFRGATRADLDRILQIYDRARSLMAETGNPTQWGGGYPPRELLEEDITSNRLFVYVVNGQLGRCSPLCWGQTPPMPPLRTAGG